MLQLRVFEEDNRQPTHLAIWLHGLGASGDDFLPLLPQFHHAGLALRFILPDAPSQAVTINAGMRMPAWYDILSLDRHNNAPQDETGIVKSIQAIHHIIDHHTHPGLGSEKVFLMGFSQGGAIATLAALTYPKPLAGLIGLSTYIPSLKQVQGTQSAHPCPVFMAHGAWDPILPLQLSQQAAATLRQRGHPVSWHDYPIGHALSPDTVKDVIQFMQKNMGA